MTQTTERSARVKISRLVSTSSPGVAPIASTAPSKGARMPPRASLGVGAESRTLSAGSWVIGPAGL